MDIARLSMGMSQAKVAQQAGVSILKMAMNTAEEQGAAMTKIMEESTKAIEMSVSPDLGSNIDIRA